MLFRTFLYVFISSYTFIYSLFIFFFFFFFNDTATTEIYTLSLHDALPISDAAAGADRSADVRLPGPHSPQNDERPDRDRKSTRLNSSHSSISYAVFCLKKKKKKKIIFQHDKKIHINDAQLKTHKTISYITQ